MKNKKCQIWKLKYDDYSIKEIDESEFNEGKISEIIIKFNKILNSVPNNFQFN